MNGQESLKKLNEGNVMDLPQVAELLKVSKESIKRWRKDLGFPTYKLGGKLIFLKDEVLEWMEKQRCD